MKNIKQLYSEILDLINFKEKFSAEIILTSDELGILRFFMHNNIDELKQMIPKKIEAFYVEEPELFETLYVFLTNAQNYTKTAEKLFVHSKPFATESIK